MNKQLFSNLCTSLYQRLCPYVRGSVVPSVTPLRQKLLAGRIEIHVPDLVFAHNSRKDTVNGYRNFNNNCVLPCDITIATIWQSGRKLQFSSQSHFQGRGSGDGIRKPDAPKRYLPSRFHIHASCKYATSSLFESFSNAIPYWLGGSTSGVYISREPLLFSLIRVSYGSLFLFS